MFLKMTKVLTAGMIVSSALITTLAQSATGTPELSDAISFGTVGYAGEGCPAGSLKINLNKGEILFKEMWIDPYKEVAFERKACAIAIPVSVAEGYKVVLGNQEINGIVQVPEHSEATLSSVVFYAGATGVQHQQKFTSDDFEAREFSEIFANNVTSACGGSGNIRINMSILSKKFGAIIVDRSKLDIKVVRCR